MSHKLAEEPLLIASPPPQRFSLDEWYLNNRTKCRFVNDQLYLADKVLVESDRLRDKCEEIAKTNRNETDHHLEVRVREIQFHREETELVRKDIVREIEALGTYKDRIMDAMNSIKSEGLRICKKCLMLREGRLGIDLVVDDVEQELKKEAEITEGAQIMLHRTLEESHEQIRRLRSTLYFMDRDLEDKINVLKIDKRNLDLRENDLNLSIYHGVTPLAISNITAEEWESITKQNFETASKEKNAGIAFRVYVDNLLKQVIEDLLNQYHAVNNAFSRRIEETKEIKTKLEVQHSEIVRQVNEMQRLLTRLELAISNKEGFMALAHTRLGNRTRRSGLELCRDIVEVKLCNEVVDLNTNLASLQHAMSEVQASLRYLLKVQIELEEEIQIKTNTLKIDEVDCMSLRQSIDYHAY